MSDSLVGANNTSSSSEEGYCSIPTDLIKSFDAQPFRNTRAIRWMHSIPPRYGKPNDVLLLMNGTKDDQKDYIRGLLAASITIFCFFLIWSLLLILFKCCCFGRPAFDKSNNKTRWLSGKPFIVNHKPVVAEDKDPDAHQEWDKQYRNVRRILFWCRATVLFAGMSIIISAVVMSIQGTNSLTQSLESGRTSIGLVHDLASEAVDIIDSVVAQNEKVAKDIFKLLEDFNTMCPLIRDPLCDDLTDLTTCNISGFLGDDLDNIIQMAIEHFNAGERSVVYQEIIKARKGLRDAQEIALSVDKTASQFNWAFYVSMAMSLVLAVLCLFIMLSLVYRMPKMMSCLRWGVVMPLFVLLVACSYVFSVVFVVASTATADVCVSESEENNIDARILTLLNRFNETLSPVVVEFATFYIRQCPEDILPQEIAQQLDYVLAGVPVIQQFSAIVEESTGLIQEVCGFAAEDSQRLVLAGEVVQVQLCEIAEILKRVWLFFQCENWFPLYETTVYEAICYDATDGFAYVASTQFVIVFMAFWIVTLRTAFWDVQIGDDDDRSSPDVDGKEDGAGLTSSDENECPQTTSRYYARITGLLSSENAPRETTPSTRQIADQDIFPDDLLPEGGGSADTTTIGLNTTFTTLNDNTTLLDSDDGNDNPYSGSSTEEDLDGSGNLEQEEHHRHDCRITMDGIDEGTGIEIENFITGRSDAWSVWARQFAGGGFFADNNNDGYDDSNMGR